LRGRWIVHAIRPMMEGYRYQRAESAVSLARIMTYCMLSR
jgi:hypothetical protein